MTDSTADPTGATTPDIRRFVGECMACRNWQVDVRPGAVSDLGGAQPTFVALAQVHADHLAACPGGDTGRVKFQGKWGERPLMSDGSPAQGLLEMSPLPRWWVSK